MADYIWVRNSDARVMSVATASSTPPAGTTEYFENHPVFDPLWTNYTWTRTGVDTYTGAPIDPTQSSPQFTVKNTSTDTTPNYLSSKLVGGTGLDLTTISPGGNETLQVDIDITEFTQDTSPVSGDYILTYDVSASAHKKALLSDAIGGGASGGDQFCGVDSTGGTDVSAGWTDILLITEHKKTSNMTHTASTAIVTVNRTAAFLISGYVTTETTTGTVDASCELRLMRDVGAGYVEVTGTRCRFFLADTTGKGGNAAFTVVLDVTSGDKFKIQAQRNMGTNTIKTLANGSGLTLSTVSAVAQGIFGNNFQNAESDAESTTTSTSAQTKLTMTTGTLPIGTYRLGWYFESTNTSILYTTITEILESATVHGREEDDQVIGSNYDMFSGYKYITYASATTHTFDMKYNTTNATGTAKIKRARFEIWRVS